MMSRGFKYLLAVAFAVCFTALAAPVAAQTIENLRDEIRKAEEEISLNNKLLQQTQTDKNVNQNELKLVRNRISNRRKIVSNLEKQASLISGNIDSKVDTISLLEVDLQNLRTEYAAMVYEAYKNYKLNNFMVFLFASRDFNDAVRRIAYMRQYNRVRERKAAEIDSASVKLTSQVTTLVGEREELHTVEQTHRNEINNLAKDEKQYNTMVTNLKRQETSLSTAIKNKQKQIDNLQKQIEKIIAEEAGRSGSKTVAEREYDVVLSGKFDQNEGKLPYPVKGVVIDHYGRHRHPTLPNVTVNNIGIKIAADNGAEIRSVFEGEVARVFFVQGSNNSVMIRHGNYFTVYSNLEKVSVKVGDKIVLNQVLGRLSSAKVEDANMLQFQLWRETTNLNPEKWLRN